MPRLKHMLIMLTCTVLMLPCLGILPLVLTDPRFFSWQLVEIASLTASSTQQSLHIPNYPSKRFTLEFSPTIVHGRSACNFFSGAYQLNSVHQSLVVSRLGSTLMVCGWGPSPIGDQEYIDLLQGANQYECNWQELRIRVSSKQTLLVFQKGQYLPSVDQIIQLLSAWIQSWRA